MKSIKISLKDWEKILEKIKKDYPPSYYLIRSISKEKLGFLPREHTDYSNVSIGTFFSKNSVRFIYLDFFDEHKKTMFILKYGHLMSNMEEK